MKKLKLILVTLLSLLLLAACGSKKSSGEVTTDPSTLAKQLAGKPSPAIRSQRSAPISWLPPISWIPPKSRLPALT